MKNVLVFGAGAIGTTVAAWLGETEASVSIYVRPKLVAHINKEGLQVYCGDTPDDIRCVDVNAYSDLDNVPTPDVILISVKTYSLTEVSKLLQNKFGKDVLVVGLQNGIDNQEVLPKYFNKVIYGVVCYNAWVDGPAKVGYQKKGPFALGHKGGVTDYEMQSVAKLMAAGVNTQLPSNFEDAAHCKIVINLANSLTTLVALHENDQSGSKAFQKLLTILIYEGVKVVEAAGYKESKLGGMPSWWLLKGAAILPAFITRRPYLKNLKKLVLSSMAQDIILKGGGASELDSINGYVLKLAKQYNISVPVNQTVYELCKKAFAIEPFKSLKATEILDQVKWQ